MTDELFATIQPVLAAAGLELVDVELRSGVLLVTVDRPGGVDLEALTDANRAVSAFLDELDPIPGRYTLEVSSPGVERTLRTPAQFMRAVGELLTVKTRPQVPGERRLRGELLAADADGLELAVEGAADGSMRLAYSDIDRARTVFVWGPEPRPGGARSKAAAPSKGRTAPNETPEKKRKQVATP
ncbi:MAG: ribosome maturation factor RimP [Acidimicrobiales bacterium]